MTHAVPVSTLVVKIASRCNLNCSYCYEYNMGDSSWKMRPGILDVDMAQLIGRRVREHCDQWGHRRFSISLHGGEPLLAGISHIEQIMGAIREKAGPAIALDFGMQTNGLLITDAIAAELGRIACSAGVSLDGVKSVNDRARVNHRGRSSFEGAVRGIECLRRAGGRVFGGLLAVIDIEADPLETFDFLAGFTPPSLDFLLPHGNWSRPPRRKEDPDRSTPYADWLIPIYDAWMNGRHRKVPIRTFEEIIEHLAGGTGGLETLGLQAVSLLTIGTDGAIEGVDTLKSAFPGAHELGLNVLTHSFDDALKHHMIEARQLGIDMLPGECAACWAVDTCGGGYFPHRYAKTTGFRNRSVYCTDLLKLIGHIRKSILAITESSRPRTIP
jgi:uncharacterized protein